MAIYRGVGGSGDSSTGEDVFGDNSTITSLIGLTGEIRTPSYIRFSPTANHTATQGELTWNTAEGTLDLGLNGGAVILQIGQELHYRVTNQSGVTIANGTLVAFAGTTGNSGKLLVEAYDGTQPSRYILGIATEDITNGSNGYVTCFGKVRGIQTNGVNYGETWVDGDELYPSASGLTNILPEAPNPKQSIAAVVNSHASNGEIFVRVQGHTSLEDDELVQLTALTNGDILQYNSTTGRFENVAPTYLDPSDIGTTVQAYDAQLTDVAGLTPTDNGVIIGNGTNFVVESGATLRASLGLTIGTDVQAYDADLAAFALKTAPTGAVVGTTDTQTLTNKTLTSPIISTISNTGTITLPTATDTLVGRATTDTLTNKTISADNNTLSGIAASSFVLSNASGNIDGAAAQKAIPSGVVVGTTDTQTLTNKTVNLSSNTLSGTKSQFNTACSDGDFVYTDAIGSTVLAYDANLQSFVNTFTLPTADSTSGFVLSTNGAGTLSWVAQTGGSMIYPGAGIAVSTGSAWGTSITDNSANWNTAYGWGNHATAGYALNSNIGITIQPYDADTAKLDVAQSWTAQQTFKELKDTVHTITDGAAFEIDPANGSIQVITLGANRTPAATNFEAGQVVLLGIDDGTAFTITWTTVAVTWVKAGGIASAPTLATTGYTWVLLWKVGSTIYGTEVGKP